VAQFDVSYFDQGKFDVTEYAQSAADTVNLSDLLASAVKGAQAEVVSLIDAIKAQVGIETADLVSLTDELVTRIGLLHQVDDALDVVDILTQLRVGMLAEDAATISDEVRAKAARVLGEMLSTSDDVMAAFFKALADDTLVSESTAMRIGTLQEEAAALLDVLQARFGKLIDDPVALIDQLITSLVLVRQAGDLVDLLDDLSKKIAQVIDEALVLDDSVAKGMRAAVDEAVDLYDTIGDRRLGRQLPDDAVGILDESRLRAVLGLGDYVGAFDTVYWRVVQVLSQVWINGVNIPVTGLHIIHASGDRTSECRFSILNPSAEVMALAVQRAEVRVYLVDGQHSEYFAGRIKGNPIRAKSTIGRQLDVTVLDMSDAANDVEVVEVFEEERDEQGQLITPNKSLIEILKTLWIKYYPYPINLSYVVVDGDRTIPKVVFKYESLFESTEKIAKLLGGWSWFVEWNGAEYILRFFPPSANIKDVTFSRANKNVVAGTARFGQDSRIANVVRVFGGMMLSEARSETWAADGIRRTYQIPKSWKAISVKVNGVLQTMGKLYQDDEWSFDCLLDEDGAAVIWREDNKPANGASLLWGFKYERPVMALYEDAASIRRYGRVEYRIVDTKIQDPTLARELARQTIMERAFPVGFGSMEILESSVRAGDFVYVDLPEYNAAGYYEIKEIERRIVGSKIKRSVTLGLTDDPNALIAERFREIMGRLAELEQREMREDKELMRVARYVEDTRITEMVTAAKQAETGVWNFDAARFGYSEFA